MKKLPIVSLLLFIFVSSSVSLSVSAQNNYNYQKRTLFEALTIDSDDIVFFGNSITDGCEWAELFENPHIKNRGISADLSGWLLDRLDPIVGGKPKKLFLMIGINDLSVGLEPEEIVANITKIVDRFQKESPRTEIYIQSLLPINGVDFPQVERLNKYIDSIVEVNSALNKMCELKCVEFIDLHTSFANEDGLLDSKYTNDGLHLMGEGYLLWKELIENQVN